MKKTFLLALFLCLLLPLLVNAEPPSIFDCKINTSSIGCGETVRFACNVTDDQAVFKTFFSLNLSWSNSTLISEANKDGEVYFYDYTASVEYNETEGFVWFLANASDLAGNVNETILDFNINYTCLLPCVEDWVADSNSCLINDSIFISYTDSNSCGSVDDLPVDNGTFGVCNFCGEDLEQVIGVCKINDSQSVSYVDNNFSSCCSVTGLVSDCSVLFSPYNVSSAQNCSFFDNDLSCDFPSVVEFKDRMVVDCVIPINVSNESFSCVSKVFEDGRLLQVNPEYKTVSSGLLTVKGDRVEPKEFFTPSNRLLNVYFTNKNLLTDKSFVFEVSCTSVERTLTSKSLITPFYDGASGVLNRLVWAKQNATYLIVSIFFVIVFILFIAWALNSLRGGRTSR